MEPEQDNNVWEIKGYVIIPNLEPNSSANHASTTHSTFMQPWAFSLMLEIEARTCLPFQKAIPYNLKIYLFIDSISQKQAWVPRT